jgi:hypothetical protein
LSDEAAVKQAADQARAAFTDIILEDLAAEEQYAAAANEHRQNLRGGPATVEAPVSPVASAAQPVEGVHVAATEAEAPAPEPTVAPSFSLEDPELPEDIAAFLNEPDFEAEAAAELVALIDGAGGEFGEEYASEETVTERKRRIAAEKKAAWLEERLAETNRSKWEAEALKYFPYAQHQIGTIKATSRRQFLRDAQAAHTAMKPHIEQYLKAAGTVVEKTVAEARTQVEAQVKDAWGNPTVDASNSVATEAAFEAEIAQSRRESRSLEDHFKRLLRASTVKK